MSGFASVFQWIVRERIKPMWSPRTVGCDAKATAIATTFDNRNLCARMSFRSKSEARITWLLLVIVLPVLALCIAVEAVILIWEACEQRFSLRLFLVFVVSLGVWWLFFKRMKEAKRRIVRGGKLND
ncbi:MAG: hypothetical protein JNL39_17900 [Opitutaceae bacterium]|nr:hypothetical protein [Opitutaceae bacterium]